MISSISWDIHQIVESKQGIHPCQRKHVLHLLANMEFTLPNLFPILMDSTSPMNDVSSNPLVDASIYHPRFMYLTSIQPTLYTIQVNL